MEDKESYTPEEVSRIADAHFWYRNYMNALRGTNEVREFFSNAKGALATEDNIPKNVRNSFKYQYRALSKLVDGYEKIMKSSSR